MLSARDCARPSRATADALHRAIDLSLQLSVSGEAFATLQEMLVMLSFSLEECGGSGYTRDLDELLRCKLDEIAAELDRTSNGESALDLFYKSQAIQLVLRR
jgi:hypothetical protein